MEQESIDFKFFRDDELLLKVIIPYNAIEESLIEDCMTQEDIIEKMIFHAAYVVNTRIDLQVGDIIEYNENRKIIDEVYLFDLLSEDDLEIETLNSNEITWN